MCNKLIVLCIALVVVGLSVPALAASAKITYVDAVDGNDQYGRTPNTRLAWDPIIWTAVPQPGSGIDGGWTKRPFGNYHTVFEANGSWDDNTENVPMLVTTITIPTDIQGCGSDTVHVYVCFWSDTSYQWRIRASLTPAIGRLPLYYPNGDRTLLTTEDGSEFVPGTIQMTREGGNRYLYIGDLGCAMLGETVDIYVDGDNDIDRTKLDSPWNARTWYDGVGYTPEPATLTLLGLGGLMLRKRRA